MEKSKFFSYAGFHFKLCSLELRELFSYIFESREFAVTVRQHLTHIKEFVPLYTCNRFDMCFFGEVSKEDIGELFWAFAIQALQARFSHISVCQMKLKEHVFKSLRFASDEEGLSLFLKVASSLDSLVLGETQILGQLKKAFRTAKQKGFAHHQATGVFDLCFRVAKRIRNETDLFKNVISIGHLVVEFSKKEFIDLSTKDIIIFGAGEMAALTAKHFLAHGAKKLFIANRTFKNAEKLSEKIAATPLELSNALNNIKQFDICVTACSGDDLIITNQYFQLPCRASRSPADPLARCHPVARPRDPLARCHLAARPRDPVNFEKKMLFIDISVPRKIDPSLSSLPNLKLFNIDQLATIVARNRGVRKNAQKSAEQIISEEIKEFFKKKQERENEQHLPKFNAWLKDVIQIEVDRFLNQKSKNKSISSSIIARSVCKKVSAKMRQKIESEKWI